MKSLKIILPGIMMVGVFGFAISAFASGTTVNVIAKEWGITPDKTSVNAGKVTFVVKNSGKDTHEVEVVKLDGKTPESFPLAKNGGADESWLVPRSMGEAEDIKPGTTKTFTADLKPGKYALVCNMVETEKDGTIEAHYSMGMRTAFTVK